MHHEDFEKTAGASKEHESNNEAVWRVQEQRIALTDLTQNYYRMFGDPFVVTSAAWRNSAQQRKHSLVKVGLSPHTWSYSAIIISAYVPTCTATEENGKYFCRQLTIAISSVSLHNFLLQHGGFRDWTGKHVLGGFFEKTCCKVYMPQELLLQ